MIHRSLSWWLDASPARRWGLPVAFLLTAAVVDLAFDRTWLFGWGTGVLLLTWVALFHGRDTGG